ncbi:hypothetical protein ACW4TU_18475 [Streptomyces sp. QTS52]
MLSGLLHRIAQRCPTHDRAAHTVTVRLDNKDARYTPTQPPKPLYPADLK